MPGLIITQHAGGGKANQYFLRGFNLDHSTDFAIFIDDMPLNLPSHAHGEGYADMNTVIPEFVQRLNFEKGPTTPMWGITARQGRRTWNSSRRCRRTSFRSERKVRPDGVHFQRLRYLSPVLAAYVGESVTVRYDPRDLGEIRVFYKDKFLCRAISVEVAGATVPLRKIVRSRKQRKSELQGILKSRQRAVDSLLDLKRGHVPKEADANLTVPVQPAAPKLKRYRNE